MSKPRRIKDYDDPVDEAVQVMRAGCSVGFHIMTIDTLPAFPYERGVCMVCRRRM